MKCWELLSKRGAWCKGKLAENADGESVTVENPKAVSWCAVGAVQRCYPDVNSKGLVSIVSKVTYGSWSWGIGC